SGRCGESARLGGPGLPRPPVGSALLPPPPPMNRPVGGAEERGAAGSPVRVFAPATVGNMACGFDVLGFALERPGDIVHVEFSETPGVEIVTITGDGGRLPRDAARNAAGLAALAVLDRAGEADRGLRMEVHKGLPLS